jgi:hypothetical protein
MWMIPQLLSTSVPDVRGAGQFREVRRTTTTIWPGVTITVNPTRKGARMAKTKTREGEATGTTITAITVGEVATDPGATQLAVRVKTKADIITDVEVITRAVTAPETTTKIIITVVKVTTTTRPVT